MFDPVTWVVVAVGCGGPTKRGLDAHPGVAVQRDASAVLRGAAVLNDHIPHRDRRRVDEDPTAVPVAVPLRGLRGYTTSHSEALHNDGLLSVPIDREASPGTLAVQRRTISRDVQVEGRA